MENPHLIKHDLSQTHAGFNQECKGVDLQNFKENTLMCSIVQNCPFKNGTEHLDFISTNYPSTHKEIDFSLLKKYDSIGGGGREKLIDGLSPKVFSYIKESLLFYSQYLLPHKISSLNNLLIIGGGYGMEAVVLHHICSVLGGGNKKYTWYRYDRSFPLAEYVFQRGPHVSYL